MKKLLICVFLFSILFTSCSGFLDEYSTDQRYCETPNDLNLLMIGTGFLGVYQPSVYSQATISKSDLTSAVNVSMYFPWLHLMDDDAEAFLQDYVTTDQGTPYYMLSAMANWSSDPCKNVQSEQWADTQWTKLYAHIGALNSIIYQGENLKGKNPKDEVLLDHVCGEAYFLRALYYFYLANVYGLPYSTATASQDFSVPLKTSPNIEDKYFTRSTNQEVYNQIWSDLKSAEQNMGNYTPDSKLRVGIGAIKAFQSRVAVYMEKYQDAVDASNSFSNLSYSLTDLRTFDNKTNFLGKSSKEVIFTVGGNITAGVFINDSLSTWDGNDNRASSFKASNDLIEKYDSKDLRRMAFFTESAVNHAPLPNKYKTWKTYNDPELVSDIFCIRYAEVVLNKAEALAMMGSIDAARTTLQNLRANRIVGAQLSDIPTDQKQLVDFIRTERRLELCFEGHRWFDLRRYSVNSKFPLSSDFTIKHPAYAYDANSKVNYLTGYYVLQSYSKDQGAWVVPVPNATIEFNLGSITNLIRNDHSIIK
nr:RagB/SusD family nutrient uptake outer membrane protein [Prevotella sp.]